MAEMRLRPEEILAWAFNTGFRGFDQAEVKRAMEACAAAVADAEARLNALASELAYVKAIRSDPTLDEEALVNALGDEAGRVLLAAKQAAADIRAKADAGAAATLEAAQAEAEAVRARARTDTAALQQAAERVLAERTEEADIAAQKIVEAAAYEGEQMKAAALEEARAMVAEARAVRTRMLEDLRQRKARGEEQLGVLRAGREQLLEAYGIVRNSLEDATKALTTADEGIRDRALPDDLGPIPDPVHDGAGLPLDVGAHTGPPSGPVAPIVPIGGAPEEELADEIARSDAAEEAEAEVEAEAQLQAEVEAEEEVEEGETPPSVDAPDVSPSTGEVPAVAATGTDDVRPGRRRRRNLRLADDPAVRAEEARLAGLRLLHQPRQGNEPHIHHPEDGMSVIHPPSEIEQVRVINDPAPSPVVADSEPEPELESVVEPVAEPVGDKVEEVVVEEVEEEVEQEAEPEVENDQQVEEQQPSAVDALFAKLRSEPEERRARPSRPVDQPSILVDDESLLQARDNAIQHVERALAKRVKRMLQDHQNTVLDSLRAKKRPSALTVLGQVEDLVGPLADAAAPHLQDAAAAGTDAGTGPDVTVPRSDDLAQDVAANVVRDLRPRLEAALSDTGTGPIPDDPAILDRINAAFREWRGERVARLVGDAVHAAYARGFFVATPASASLRWIVDDGDAECPDCEDNALAGALPKGEPFPTGQRHPPAHSGCRCILA